MTREQLRAMVRELGTPRWLGTMAVVAVGIFVVLQTGHELVRVTWGAQWAHRFDVVLAGVALVAMAHRLTARVPPDDTT